MIKIEAGSWIHSHTHSHTHLWRIKEEKILSDPHRCWSKSSTTTAFADQIEHTPFSIQIRIKFQAHVIGVRERARSLRLNNSSFGCFFFVLLSLLFIFCSFFLNAIQLKFMRKLQTWFSLCRRRFTRFYSWFVVVVCCCCIICYAMSWDSWCCYYWPLIARDFSSRHIKIQRVGMPLLRSDSVVEKHCRQCWSTIERKHKGTI